MDEEPSSALLKLRALLTPQAPAQAPEVPAEPEESVPDWTSRYCVVDAAGEPTALSQLAVPLSAPMRKVLSHAGYDPLFPIQASVIPLLCESARAACDYDSAYCCDVCVSAPTGQGKTLAYAVPIVEALLHRLSPRPRAVVLLPTRDLAMQVCRVFDALIRGLKTGRHNVAALRLRSLGMKAIDHERQQLSQGPPPDVVVCTPGRLAEHFLGRGKVLDLAALRWFVIDEADRLLSQSYHRWLEVLERATMLTSQLPGAPPRPRPQKLLFSATMTWDPRKLAALKLTRPLYFFSSRTGQHTTPAQLRQFWLRCPAAKKPLAILHLLRQVLQSEAQDALTAKVIVFCQSVNTAHRLARLLQILWALQGANARTSEELAEEEQETDDEVMSVGDAKDAKPTGLANPVAEFSSSLSPRERSALLRRFRSAKVKCLVCSDIVARGIDIPAVSAVINYTAPSHLQTYIHRVGRTARAGKVGNTFTFVASGDHERFKEMLSQSADCWERISKFTLPRAARNPPSWWQEALDLLQRCLDAESKGRLSTAKILSLEALRSEGASKAPARKRAAEPQAFRADDALKKAARNQKARKAPAAPEAEETRARTLWDFACSRGPLSR